MNAIINTIKTKTLEETITRIKPQVKDLVFKIKATSYLGVKSELMNKIGDLYQDMFKETKHHYFKEKAYHSYCAARNFATK